MIAFLKGTIEDITENSLVLDVNGIGYEVLVPGQLLDMLEGIGQELKVYTYMQVREDAVVLFGFLTRDDLAMFKMLIGVNGVGPKAGLGILSALGTEELRFAVLADDAKRIAKAPGIGAKTAQRVILELKDKLNIEDVFEKADQTADIPVKAADQTAKNEAIQALTALGYSASEALSAVSKLEITEDMDTENILKAALKQMAFL